MPVLLISSPICDMGSAKFPHCCLALVLRDTPAEPGRFDAVETAAGQRLDAYEVLTQWLLERSLVALRIPLLIRVGLERAT